MSSVKVEDISFKYQKEQIIKDLNLVVEAGQFCVIVGPSGCGKSTLLELVAGLLIPNAGKLLIDGIDMTAKEPKERSIGYVFQDYALYPNMSVYKNIEFGLKVQKVAKSERQVKINRILEKMDLSSKADSYPQHLSGGQKQRVAIARALVMEPKILLMDEPLSSLDAGLKNQMRTYLKQIHEKFELTTIFVTHDQSEALSLADKIVVLNEGEIVQTGTSRQVYKNPASEFVLRFFNSKHLNELTPTVQALLGIEPLADKKCFVRTGDITYNKGGEWIVIKEEIEGERQTVSFKYLDYTIKLSASSSIEFNKNQKFTLTAINYFAFE